MISRKTKPALFRLTAVSLGIILCLIALEVLFGTLLYFGYTIDSIVNTERPPVAPSDKSYAYEIPHPPIESLYQPQPVKRLETYSQFPLDHLDPSVDFTMTRIHFNGTITRYREGSRVPIYSMDVTTDEVGRRTLPLPQTSTPWTGHLAAMGCSYVFGEGLNSTQTLSAYLLHHFPSYKPYNLGLSGYGVNDVLARTLNYGFMDNIEPKKGVGLYFFMENHLQRSLGFFSILGSWGDRKAIVRETSPYHFEYRGTYFKKMWSITRVLQLLWKTNTVQFFHFDWPLRVTNEHHDRLARMIKGLELEYKKRTAPENPFIVIIYPEFFLTMNVNDFKDALERHKIYFLDYGEAEITFRIPEQARIDYDNHPNAAANKHIAGLIARDLHAYFR